ncbi:MAG: hypothetical protein KGL35_08005 [Bradyrhizobium sp.]|nr:hypothetical protein [Bradyrhizobium sp.]
MHIELRKTGDTWRADCKDLPGSPPVGVGETEAVAVAHLFYRLHFGRTEGRHSVCWMEYIEPGEVKVTTISGEEPTDAE